ncbi:MAG: hypothetical protein M1472_00180, partial [Planctomycetes bacterium]|nr:hypothetical protein [Planctomycetota bacterium]
ATLKANSGWRFYNQTQSRYAVPLLKRCHGVTHCQANSYVKPSVVVLTYKSAFYSLFISHYSLLSLRTVGEFVIMP